MHLVMPILRHCWPYYVTAARNLNFFQSFCVSSVRKTSFLVGTELSELPQASSVNLIKLYFVFIVSLIHFIAHHMSRTELTTCWPKRINRFPPMCPATACGCHRISQCENTHELEQLSAEDKPLTVLSCLSLHGGNVLCYVNFWGLYMTRTECTRATTGRPSLSVSLPSWHALSCMLSRRLSWQEFLVFGLYNFEQTGSEKQEVVESVVLQPFLCL